MADVSERFKNAVTQAVRVALAQATPAPPPPLASDVRVLERRQVPIPKTFRDLLGLIGGEAVQVKADSCSLEVRHHHPGIPDLDPGIEPPEPSSRCLVLHDAIVEAFALVKQEMYDTPLLTDSLLNKRGCVTVDPLAWHRLGWQAGDRVRVVLEEEYLRFIRLDQSVKDARLNAS